MYQLQAYTTNGWQTVGEYDRVRIWGMYEFHSRKSYATRKSYRVVKDGQVIKL